MVEINLKTPLKTVSGEVMQTVDQSGKDTVDTLLGDILIGILNQQAETEDAVRTFRICVDMSGKDTYTCDKDTLEYLVRQIKKFKGTPVVKGQILIMLEELNS